MPVDRVRSMDNIKLIVVALLVLLGVVGFYFFANLPTVVRVLIVLAGVASAMGVFSLTETGRRFFAFSQESVGEARKVVWPTRKETMQMTGIVAVFVVTMALFLWMVDGALLWLVSLIMGRGA